MFISIHLLLESSILHISHIKICALCETFKLCDKK